MKTTLTAMAVLMITAGTTMDVSAQEIIDLDDDGFISVAR